MDFGLGDLVSAGVSLFEGDKQRSLSKKQFKMQMDESIQRRVADAKKAGIHPLFGLGASVGASPTTHYGGGDISAAGDALGSAVDKAMSASDKKGIQAKNEQVLDSQIRRNDAAAKADEAQAGWYDAQAAKARQGAAATGRDQGVSDIEGQGLVTYPLRPQEPTAQAIPLPQVTQKGKRQVSGERQLAAEPTDNLYKLPFGWVLRTGGAFSPSEALEQHYGDVGSVPWQVLAFIEDSVKGRVYHPRLEAWWAEASPKVKAWFKRELREISKRFPDEKRRY